LIHDQDSDVDKKKGRSEERPFFVWMALLDLRDVLGGGAFRTLHDVELNPVAFG
jgi:hypothetical protein